MGTPYAAWEAAATIINYNGPATKSGFTQVNSFGNNSVDFGPGFFSNQSPPQ